MAGGPQFEQSGPVSLAAVTIFPKGLLLAAAASLALAAHAPAQEVDGTGEQLNATEQQLQGSKANQQRIEAEIDAAIREQDDVSARLVSISGQIQSQEAAITASEKQLKTLQEEQVLLLASLGEKQEVLSELLAGLQRLEQNPPPALVVEPDDVLAALRGAMLFGTIVPELQSEADKLAKELARLETLKGEIIARKQDLSDEIARLETSRQDLSGLIEQKKELVSRNHADLEAERKRTAELAGKAANLKQLMASLAAERQRLEAERLKKAAADELERQRLEELKRRPRMVFADARGQLSYPAQGSVLRHYGDPDGLGGESQGLVIATRQGAQVTSPADGEVEFAGSFRSYGQVVILNPGGGYRILLAGMGNITAVTGETLRAGEPLGQMGNGPSSVTLLGDVMQNGQPVLYIEFRNSTSAIDSGPWWIGSNNANQEARG